MKIAIFGMGLIGASLGKAILKYTDHEVYGFDTDSSVLERAGGVGAHTRALKEEDYCTLDMAIFALYPNAAIAEMTKVCPRLKAGTIVTDTCGNKRDIVSEMEKLKSVHAGLYFVGAHPMAGREYSGIDSSLADLFCGAYVILTPVSYDGDKLAAVKDLYKQIGARGVEICTAKFHDEMIAFTSQLAHVVSNCYAQNPLSQSHTGYSAGSYGDLTRVARLNPDMWTELFLENADNLGDCLDDIIARLSQFRAALSELDGERMKIILSYGTACKENSDSLERKHIDE